MMTTAEKLAMVHAHNTAAAATLDRYTDEDVAGWVDMLLAAGWERLEDGSWLDPDGGGPNRQVLRRIDKREIDGQIIDVPVYQTESPPLQSRHPFLAAVVMQRQRDAAKDPDYSPIGKFEQRGTGKMLKQPDGTFAELVQTHHTPAPTIGLPPPSRVPEAPHLSTAEQQRMTDALTAAGWKRDAETGYWRDPEGEVAQKPRLVKRPLGNKGLTVEQWEHPQTPSAYDIERAYRIMRARETPRQLPKPVLKGTGQFVKGPKGEKVEVRHWNHPAIDAEPVAA